MMKIFRLLTVFALLPFAGNVCMAAEMPAGEDGDRYALDHIVAIVNDGIIVSSDLEQAIVNVEKQLQEKDTPIPPRNVMVKQVLERLVVEKLQLQIAENNGLNIDDSTLNDEIGNLARENGLDLTGFRQVLERDGFDYSAFREDLRKQLLIQQVRRQMISSRVKVNDQEVDNLLASLKASGKGDVEYHLAHILVAIPDAASPEQIKAAEGRASRLLAAPARRCELHRNRYCGIGRPNGT